MHCVGVGRGEGCGEWVCTSLYFGEGRGNFAPLDDLPPLDEVFPPLDEVLPPLDEVLPPLDEVLPPPLDFCKINILYAPFSPLPPN